MNIKRILNSYYRKYNSQQSSRDPVWNLQFAKSNSEKELLAFVVSCYSYGNIVQINNFIKKFINLANGNVLKFIMEFDPDEFCTNDNFCYRFNTEKDFVDLILSIKYIVLKYGSLKSLFLKHYNESDVNILNALDKFTSEIRSTVRYSKSFEYLIPVVSKKSTCKRLNLFLRWMVRKDSIDTGIWSREVDKSKLIIPVDTHVYKVSRNLGLVSRKSCDIKFAVELTEKLKSFDPLDPVKYDFALCHIGVDKILL